MAKVKLKKMIKRADGSYSQQGLWDSLRANIGSGKAPTKEMLKQEKKIKSKAPDGVTLENQPKPFQPATGFNSVFDPNGQQPIVQPIAPKNPMVKNPNYTGKENIAQWKDMPKMFNPVGSPNTNVVDTLNDKYTPKPKKERNRKDLAPYFLGGLAAADLLLPDVNRERQQDFNRPEDEPYYNPYPNGLGSGALAKNGKTLKQYPDGGGLKPINQGKPVSSQDSLRHQAGKMMDFEARKGSPTGTGLSNWGYHHSQLHVSDVPPNWKAPQTKEEAVNLYMKEIAPKLKYFPSAMEKGEAGDFTYNTGRDARVYMLDQFIKSKGDKNGLPNRGSYNKDIKTNDWTPELQKSLDEQWDKYSPEINKLPENQRRILLNKGRDFYYQNINKKPDGSPNDSYEATWKPRIWESVNTYEDGGNIQTNGDDLQLLSDDTDIEQISPSFHKFKDGKHGVKNEDGSEGVPIAYNGQVVEAQSPETFATQSNGDGTVFSDKTKHPITGKSFKYHTEELAKFENKHVLKPLKKAEQLAQNIDEQDPFDKLKANTVRAKQMGINKAQEFVQIKTDELAATQQHILDISEQTGMKPNEVSKQMKTAKYGMTIPKADKGLTTGDPEEKEYKGKKYRKVGKDFTDGSYKRIDTTNEGDFYNRPGDKRTWRPVPKGWTKEQLAAHNAKKRAGYKKEDNVFVPASKDKGELIPIESKVKPGGIVPKGNVQPVGNITPVPNTQPQPLTFDTEEQITPIEYGKVRNGNWKNYVGPAFGVLDRVNNRSDPGINPRLKDVGEFQNRKLAQINSQGRAFQQGATSTGASVAELATGMGGFAEQAANSEAEIQAFNQGNKNMVYNENIGIVNDFAKFNSGINTKNNERRLKAEGNTKTRNIEALNTIGKYSAMEDRDRNAFVVNQGYYPTYGHDKNTLQPNVRPNQNPFDNDAMFQVGDGRYSRNTPSSTQVRTKDGNTTTTNTYTPQKPVTPPKPKKGKYGMSLVKEFKRYKP